MGLVMNLESLAYYFFGNNLIIGSHIRRQIEFLKGVLPPHFRHRKMDDLGCGDGKVTVLLKDIFLPSRLRGFDVSAGLVRRARGWGIDAEVKNLDDGLPAGELAVMWGVLHHLKDCSHCLGRLKENYPLIFIREPVRNSYFRWLELGHTMRTSEIETLVNECLLGAQVYYCGNSVLIFYVSPQFSIPG
jgi:hypothetical protein